MTDYLKRKNILYVQPNARIGGSFQSLYYFLAKIDKTKYSVMVLLPEKNNALIEKLNTVGAKSIVCSFPVISYSINFKYRLLITDFIKCFFLMNYYMRKMPDLSPDLIHLNSLNSIFGFFLAKKLRVPLIWHVREQMPEVFRGRVRKYLLKLLRDDVVKNIICISENESKGLPSEKICVVYNFYNLERQPIKPSKPIRFITIGSFTADKGFWLLIEAVRQLSIQYTPRDFRICLMGISPRKTVTKKILQEKTEKHFMAQIAQHQLQAYFELYQQQHEIQPGFFARFHVLIRPSLNNDPWGRDIIEAMSTGRGIIATGCYPKFVREGFNGYLVQEPDPIALAKKIQKFIDDEQLVVKFGENSFMLAKELFDPIKNTRQVEMIYDELLELNG